MFKKQLSLWGVFLAFCFTSITAQDYEMYVSDAGNFNVGPWQILKFDADGSNGSVLIDDHINWPQDIFFIEEKNEVLISNLGSHRVSKFNATTGDYIGEFTTDILGPTRMKLGTDSLLYILQWSGGTKVKRFQLDGTLVDEFTETTIGTAIGLDWDSGGNLYVASYNAGFVRKFSPTGADLGNFLTGLSGPTNIWFGDNDDLFVCEWNVGRVRRFDKDGNPSGVFISGIGQVEGVDFLPNGNILLGAGSAAAVKMYAPDGTFIEDVVPSGTLGLLQPNAVVLREKTTNAVQPIQREVALFSPSIGTQFSIQHIEEDFLNRPCTVYDSSGQMVWQFRLQSDFIFDASGLSDGLHLFKVELENGQIGVQKLMVQH